MEPLRSCIIGFVSVLHSNERKIREIFVVLVSYNKNAISEEH